MAVYFDDKRKTYYFVASVKVNGKPKQVKRRGFRTKRDARLAEAEIKIEYENKEVTPESMKFNDLTKEYKEWYKTRRKASSYSKISEIIKLHLDPYFKNKKISKITVKNVMDLQNNLIDKKYSVSHIKKIHTILSGTLSYAVKQGYIKNNVARLAGNVELDNEKHINYWVLDEFKEFISCVDELLYYTLFMTLYYSGMRKGELLALTWRDIDFEEKTINVNKTSYDRNITTPKTKASTRIIYMPNHVLYWLKKLKLSKLSKPSYVVFGEYTTHISESTLDRAFAKYLKLYGVKKIRIHDFRHSHASYLINQKAIISVVAKRLGHGDVATTLNTYSHLYPTTEKEVVSQMEDDFKPADVIQLNFK